jgi:hypothetical protein
LVEGNHVSRKHFLQRRQSAAFGFQFHKPRLPIGQAGDPIGYALAPWRRELVCTPTCTLDGPNKVALNFTFPHNFSPIVYGQHLPNQYRFYCEKARPTQHAALMFALASTPLHAKKRRIHRVAYMSRILRSQVLLLHEQSRRKALSWRCACHLCKCE